MHIHAWKWQITSSGSSVILILFSNTDTYHEHFSFLGTFDNSVCIVMQLSIWHLEVILSIHVVDGNKLAYIM